ncbi:CopG family transcriptional regulator [Candidatus Bathyarchaeota archaeon]|nr:CopG family transcriptional regulator [Candidatus Bathyarchaeota archaeon]
MRFPYEGNPDKVERLRVEADRLVELGIFQNRSDAIRELIRHGIENLSYLNEVSKALERLFEIERIEGDIPVKLSGATKQLLEER